MSVERFIDQVLALAERAGVEAEAMGLESRETIASFEANRLKSVTGRQSAGCAVRVIIDGRIGLASTNRLDDPARTLAAARETARYGAAAAFSLPVRVSYPHVPIFDAGLDAWSSDAMVAFGAEVIGRVRDGSSEVQCDSRVSKSATSFWLRNTSGAEVAYAASLAYSSVEATRIRGTDMLFAGEGEATRSIPAFGARIAEETLRQLRWAEATATAPANGLPVLFSEDAVASILLPPIQTALNGKVVLQGASPLGGRLGEAVFDPDFSLVDDGTLSMRPGSAPSDDEGIPTRRTVLVHQGAPQSFLYDLQTAGLSARSSTGNGSRGLESLPGPAPHALLVGEGKAGSLAELIAGMRDGLLVEQVIGADQGNVLGGDFGGNVILGFRVRNGEIVGRVKDTMIAGNVYAALRRIPAISGVGRWVGGSLFAPAMLLDGISVASADNNG